MATVSTEVRGMVSSLGELGYNVVCGLGDLTLFSGRMFSWVFRKRPAHGTLLASLNVVGVKSVPVVAITGVFIGMVLAVQSYSQFHSLGLDTRLGGIINISVVRELGPVLAATMIAGRVGSAMAAELGTMVITDQVDAMTCLGVNSIHYLVVPRFLACVILIPALTVLADFMGIMGGALICTKIYAVEAHHYWTRSQQFVGLWDVSSGLIKSIFFGAEIAIISCQRGFNCKAGAEGVGRAATEAFVASFIAILVSDFFLAMVMNNLHERLFPSGGRSLF